MLRPPALHAQAQCNYCGQPALYNTYPLGPGCPVPVCGSCANR